MKYFQMKNPNYIYRRKGGKLVGMYDFSLHGIKWYIRHRIFWAQGNYFRIKRNLKEYYPNYKKQKAIKNGLDNFTRTSVSGTGNFYN